MLHVDGQNVNSFSHILVKSLSTRQFNASMSLADCTGLKSDD